MAETVFVCSNCGNEFAKWAGQCAACGEWNSLKEARGNLRSVGPGRATTRVAHTDIKKLSEIKLAKGVKSNIYSTQISEFDRVLGKGLVQGQVVLFAGEPGIGKSTLLTQLIGKLGGLYVAGEESAEQINLRVQRLGVRAEGIDVLETNEIENIEEIMNRTNNVYKLMVVDSIQTMMVGMTAGGVAATATFGSVNQIRETTFRLIELAKKTGVTVIVVGHVTKEGDIAGPKLLEHMVDTVLYFEGDRNSDLRILRVTKNRFGPTDEVGVFKMEEGGLREIKSEEINLISGGSDKVGSAVTVVMEGSRPMMVEVQALVTESFAPMPTRVFSGIDYNRGKLLTAVVQKVLGLPLYKYDVYLSVTGGIKIEDTGADLAVVAAMYSSYKNEPLAKSARASGQNPPGPAMAGPPSLDKEGKKQMVYVGEVSLLGEVKKVRAMDKREKEVRGMGRVMSTIYSIRDLKI